MLLFAERLPVQLMVNVLPGVNLISKVPEVIVVDPKFTNSMIGQNLVLHFWSMLILTPTSKLSTGLQPMEVNRLGLPSSNPDRILVF